MADTATNGCSNGDTNGKAESHEIDPEVKHLVFEWITDTLQHAWIQPQAERKKAIKQLFLKWHPDKNVDDPQLSLEATQHIQKEVERLEMGIPRPRSHLHTTPSYSTSFAYSSFRPRDTPSTSSEKNGDKFQSYFDDIMAGVNRRRDEMRREFEQRDRFSRFKEEEREREREQARRERERQRREEQEREDELKRQRREEFKREQEERRLERQQRYEKAQSQVNGESSSKPTPTAETNGTSSSAGSTSTSYTKKPSRPPPTGIKLTDEEIVEGLLRQSACDIKAAENDMGAENAAYEWACFKAHQASEKAIKALQFFRIGLKSNSHELTTLAASLRDTDLMDLASNVQEKIGSNNKLYNMILSDYTIIPHDDYTVEMALEAVTSAKDILERAKELID